MTEADKWLEINVKPTVPGAQVNRLDDHLTQSLPAAVTQHLERGEWSYRPNPNGEFEVRLFVPALRRITEGVIKHNSFEVTRIKEMPEGKELPLNNPPQRP